MTALLLLLCFHVPHKPMFRNRDIYIGGVSPKDKATINRYFKAIQPLLPPDSPPRGENWI
jgi:hypothetical protein